MNVFENLEKLIKDVNIINEGKWEDLDINPEMETEEQGREYIRDYFKKELTKPEGGGGGGPQPPIPPMPIDPTPPPPPFIKRQKKSSGGNNEKSDPKLWQHTLIEWGDDDEFLKQLEIEAQELDDIDENLPDDDKYDDFTDSEDKGPITVGDDNDDDDNNTGENDDSNNGNGGNNGSDDDNNNNDDDNDNDGNNSKNSSNKNNQKNDKNSDSSQELKDAIEDALKELAEQNETEKEDLEELIDMLKDENTTEEDIEEKQEQLADEKENGKERFDKLKSLVGRIEKAPSKEDIKKELEASKLSKEEIEEIENQTIETAENATPPKDEELERLKNEAVEELEKKCKNDTSRLATSVLYHSLKTPKLSNEDWKVILEKILGKKSKNIDERQATEKTNSVRLGDKKHLWRGDARLYYKKVKQNSNSKNIYCFVDYSGSVKNQQGLIITFFTKVMELMEKLKFADLTIYTFAEELSLPKKVNQKKVDEVGVENALTDILKYFDLKENDVGSNTTAWGYILREINKIKRDDKDAVFFIFGDGEWSPILSYANSYKQHSEDIIPFIFYVQDWKIQGEVGRIISLFKDVIGIKDLIVTKADKMKQ